MLLKGQAVVKKELNIIKLVDRLRQIKHSLKKDGKIIAKKHKKKLYIDSEDEI